MCLGDNGLASFNKRYFCGFRDQTISLEVLKWLNELCTCGLQVSIIATSASLEILHPAPVVFSLCICPSFDINSACKAGKLEFETQDANKDCCTELI